MLENQNQKRSNTSLGGFINDQGSNRTAQVQEMNQYYNNSVVYLTLLSINLVHRFPDVSNLDAIDTTTVRSISRFAEGCSKIVLEDHWESLQGQEQQQGQQIAGRRAVA